MGLPQPTCLSYGVVAIEGEGVVALGPGVACKVPLIYQGLLGPEGSRFENQNDGSKDEEEQDEDGACHVFPGHRLPFLVPHLKCLTAHDQEDRAIILHRKWNFNHQFRVSGGVVLQMVPKG